MKKFSCLALFAVLTFAPGCGSGGTGTTTPTTSPVDPSVTANAAKIAKYSADATAVGLGFYAASNPTTAKAIATQIQTIVTGALLPYLNGSANISTLAVNTFLKENLVVLPTLIQLAISTAATVLDGYISAPSATALLSPTELAYIKAFTQGLSDGAAQFLAGGAKAVRDVPVNTVGHWLDFTK